MKQAARQELLRVAARYLWWETPTEAVRQPIRVVAQVMDIGDFDDVRQMISVLGTAPLWEAIFQAQPGWFSGPSWGYWCYRLAITAPGDPLPPMPRRTFGAPEA